MIPTFSNTEHWWWGVVQVPSSMMFYSNYKSSQAVYCFVNMIPECVWSWLIPFLVVSFYANRLVLMAVLSILQISAEGESNLMKPKSNIIPSYITLIPTFSKYPPL